MPLGLPNFTPLDFLAAKASRVRKLIKSVENPTGESHVQLEAGHWQYLLDLQSRMAEYLRKIGRNEEI